MKVDVEERRGWWLGSRMAEATAASPLARSVGQAKLDRRPGAHARRDEVVAWSVSRRR